MPENEPETFPKLLLRNSRNWPQAVAMRKKHFGIWKEYTWKECFENVKYLSLGLMRLGFRQDEMLGVIGEKQPEWFWAEFAAQCAGGIPVGIYTDMEAEEIRYVSKNTPFVVVAAHNQEQVDKFLDLRRDLPAVRHILYWDSRGLKNYHDPLLKSFEEILALGKNYESGGSGALEENIAKGEGEDCAAIYYTAGNGGLCRAAMLSHRALISSGRSFLEHYPNGSQANFFSYLPAAWIGEGILVVAAHLLAGAILNFPEEPETIQEDLREIAPEVILSGARQWEDLARMIQLKMRRSASLNRLLYRYFLRMSIHRPSDKPGRDDRPGLAVRILRALGDRIVFHPLRANLGLNKCRIAITTGSPISADCFHFWAAQGLGLKDVYASTEAGFIAGHRSGKVRSGTMGDIPRTAAVRISDRGEILVKGSAVFTGFYPPEKTRETLEDGWVHTGDLGFMDSQGELVLFDQLSTSTHGKGVPVTPSYIEGRLRFSLYIKDAMVVGEQRDFFAVIVVLDFETLGKWAEDHKIKYVTFAELSQQEEVCRLIRAEIQRVNRETLAEGRIRKFALLNRQFHAEEGELTRTGKLKRKFLEERYADLVNAFYGRMETKGMGSEAPLQCGGGRDGMMKMDIRIWPVNEDAP